MCLSISYRTDYDLITKSFIHSFFYVFINKFYISIKCISYHRGSIKLFQTHFQLFSPPWSVFYCSLVLGARFCFLCRRTSMVMFRRCFPASLSPVQAAPHSCVMFSGHSDTWPASVSQVKTLTCHKGSCCICQMYKFKKKVSN